MTQEQLSASDCVSIENGILMNLQTVNPHGLMNKLIDLQRKRSTSDFAVQIII